MRHQLAQQEQRRQNTLLLSLAVAVVASLAFSDFLTRTELGVASFWPANGLLAVGLMALNPPRRIALTSVMVVFHLIIDLLVGDSFGKALLYTSVDVLEAYAVWAVARRFSGGVLRLRTMRQLALLVAMGAPIAAAAALICAPPLSITSGTPLLTLLWAWFARSGLGLAVVLPAVLVLLDAEHRRTFHRSITERLALYASIAAMTAICFHPDGVPAPFLIFPLAMLAAFRLGARGAAESSLVVACIAIPLVTSTGDLAMGMRWETANPTRVAQVFISLLFGTNLATGLALAQQERLKRLLVRREQLTRAASAPPTPAPGPPAPGPPPRPRPRPSSWPP